jgi:hypothetical protein
VLAVDATGKEEPMRASTDQVRDLTLDVVDGARKRASDVVTHGAERVASTFDGAAATLGDGVERIVERVPSVGVAVQQPRRTHRLRTVLLVSVVLVVVVAVARKLRGNAGEEMAARPSRPDDDSSRSNGDRPAAEKADDGSDEAEPIEDANVADG